MTRTGDYLWDRSGPTDPEVKRLERLLSEFRHQRPRRHRFWQHPVSWIALPLAAAAILVLAFGLLDRGPKTDKTGIWLVSVALGTPTIDGRAIKGTSPVTNGQWLDTDGMSRLRIDLDGYGEILLEPRTRMRIVSTESARPQIQLDEGIIHAALWSDSDVSITTPSATAVERNGEFVMAVDVVGRVCLSVNQGRVTLRNGAQESIVPAGAVCEANPDSGPGTPFCENAPDRFRAALEVYDFSDHSLGALNSVLAEAGTCDLVPLWHLLQRVDILHRGRVFDHMAILEPPPTSVTRDGVIALRPGMLDRWWETIRYDHSCLMCSDSEIPENSSVHDSRS